MEVSFRTFWFEGKRWLEDTIGLSGSEAHVHIGLAVFLIAAVLLRNRRSGILFAWLLIAALQGLNEALDARDWINWTGTINWPETLSDFIVTLLWPSVLALIWRRLDKPADAH